MNTQMDSELVYEIASAIREGNLRIEIRNDEANEAAEQRMAKQAAELMAKWQPLIKAIEESIPPWAHQFLTHPMISPEYYNEHEWLARPATIAIPDVATIFAYGYTSSPVRVRPARYAVSDDDETWGVIMLGGHPLGHWERGDLTNDFHIALAAAAAEYEREPELQAEADRRNAERQKAKVEATSTPATTRGPDWLAGAIEYWRTPGTETNDRAIACALIGILEQLRKITTPLYDGSQHAIQTFDNSRGQV